MDDLHFMGQPLAIMEIQTKTAWRFHLAKVRGSKINKQVTTNVGEDI